jgi:hypothetical protein
MSWVPRYPWYDPDKDQIVTVWGTYANGPGWANQPMWVIVRNQFTGALRQECIQPEDQTYDMHMMFNISANVSTHLVNAVTKAVQGAT